MIPKVAVIHDISGLGRCSLTAAIPVLSALGVQACPVPTAVLSNQTGYPSYALLDCEPVLRRFPEEWRKRGIRLDGIYTGFFSSLRQIAAAQTLIDEFRGSRPLLLVDPIMADHGERYPGFDDAMCAGIASLVRQADIVTPNLTEACLLTGEDYAAVFRDSGAEVQRAALQRMAKALLGMGAGIAVITGWRQGESIYNAAAQGDSFRLYGSPAVEGSYSGTGDLFASALCGQLVKGAALEPAIRRAARFLEVSLRGAAHSADYNPDGIPFEPRLQLLMENDNAQE
ncbi:MAG: pyridoxamine kinase [Oscillospiraceae bacterium]|nr:pyridoxamine kinase [Oscillospiraceae bacterium]